MTTTTDYALAILIGFFVGIFFIPTAVNVGIRDPKILLAAPWIFAVAAFIGLWIGVQMARRMAFFGEFSKFAIVGVLNTAIDFGVLNGLSLITGATAGFIIGGVNVPGVVIAVCNAYLWNKLWVFKHREQGTGLFHDFPKFLLVSGIGILINSGIIIMVTSLLAPAPGTIYLYDLTAALWLNLAKALATGVSLVWNFLGYKFFVFQKERAAATVSQQVGQSHNI